MVNVMLHKYSSKKCKYLHKIIDTLPTVCLALKAMWKGVAKCDTLSLQHFAVYLKGSLFSGRPNSGRP